MTVLALSFLQPISIVNRRSKSSSLWIPCHGPSLSIVVRPSFLADSGRLPIRGNDLAIRSKSHGHAVVQFTRKETQR